jgi:hypothetical protein
MGKLLQQMSRDLLVPIHDLEYLARSAPYRYKVYEIEKRQAGSKRIIAQPAREVKRLQYWVIANILNHYPIHPASVAYRKGKSILNNAKPHSKKRFLLKLDFKDFFHSITAIDFEQFIRESKSEDIDESDVAYLTRILFWRMTRGGDLVLSIGAPSSPLLSNILLHEFDHRVAEYCKPIRVAYTRYADDLTFSTNRNDVLRLVEAEVERICHGLPYPRLTLNPQKTIHASKANLRRVTGLVLSNDGSVSIGHERKRQLHAAVHHFKLGKLSPDETTALTGMLAFVHSVEPKFLRTLARRYGKNVVVKLLKGSHSE